MRQLLSRGDRIQIQVIWYHAGALTHFTIVIILELEAKWLPGTSLRKWNMICQAHY